MMKYIKQYWIKSVVLIVIIAAILIGNFYFRSNFHAGECVQGLDGYIWHINNFQFGKYTLMGWQRNAWGNEVTMEKSILERYDSRIAVYHQVVCPEYTPIENTQAQITQPVTQTPQPTKAIMETNKFPSRVATQLKSFNDYLEYSLVSAQVDCTVLVSYNNVVRTGQMDAQTFQQAFPESREAYESRCHSAYVDVNMNQKILVAEPELQSLRALLTSYTEEVKTFSQYALGGGSQASYIDSADKKMDNLRTLSREEVLKLQRQYNVPL
jgi:hypothetical protein